MMLSMWPWKNVSHIQEVLFCRVTNHQNCPKSQSQPFVSLDFRGEIQFFLPKTHHDTLKGCLKTSSHCKPFTCLTSKTSQHVIKLHSWWTLICIHTYLSHLIIAKFFPLHPDHSPNPSLPSHKLSPFFLPFATLFHPTLVYNTKP
jgi:hypothetical protein